LPVKCKCMFLIVRRINSDYLLIFALIDWSLYWRHWVCFL
jgi:hypothetical protein